MATYDSSLQAVHRPSAPAPYLVSNTINIATENTNNAAALAANDILEIFTIPANTLIMASGYEVEALLTGESNDTTFNLGITSASTGGIAADVDEFVAAMDTDAMAVGAYATMIPGVFPAVVAGSTTDLELQAAGTAPTGGKIRVWAVLMNIDNPGDLAANEVDRDQLA
jgi:hypothetical protein